MNTYPNLRCYSGATTNPRLSNGGTAPGPILPKARASEAPLRSGDQVFLRLYCGGGADSVGRGRERRPALPVRTRSGSLDRSCATPVYDRRQAEAGRDRQARQPLPASANRAWSTGPSLLPFGATTRVTSQARSGQPARLWGGVSYGFRLIR